MLTVGLRVGLHDSGRRAGSISFRPYWMLNCTLIEFQSQAESDVESIRTKFRFATIATSIIIII